MPVSRACRGPLLGHCPKLRPRVHVSKTCGAGLTASHSHRMPEFLPETLGGCQFGHHLWSSGDRAHHKGGVSGTGPV